MLEIIFYVLIFIMGMFFGSFFTLATYRLPLGKDITHERSFCPNCGHKLKILDLIPIFSYLFLGGKCRYCEKKISIRYLCFELLSGIVFLLLAVSLKLDLHNLQISQYTYFVFLILYFCALFLIAGIDKEKRAIQRSVLLYGFVLVAVYMIYLGIIGEISIVYHYFIYLVIMLVFVLLDTFYMKKRAITNYSIQIAILSIYMIIFTGELTFFLTLMYTLAAIFLYEVMKKIQQKAEKYKVKEHKEKVPIAFYLCTCNIVLTIMMNILIHY